MKHLILFEQFINEGFDYDYYLNKYGKEFADSMAKTKWGSQSKETKKNYTIDNITVKDIKSIIDKASNIDTENIDEKEATKHVIDLFNTLKKLPNKITLYRVIATNSIEDINKKNIGKHCVLYSWMVNGDLLNSAGIGDEHDNIYVVTMEVEKSEIDIPYTIITNYGYMTENEISLKDNAKVDIIRIDNIDDFDNSVNENLSLISLYSNVPNDNIKQIKDLAKFFKLKKNSKDFIPSIQEYLFTEFKWKRENEVVNVLRKGTSKLIDSIMPYHEVVEYLAHGGEPDTWDWAHPIAVEITGNKLKQIIPDLIPYTNDEIQEATCPLLHGYQLTGNYFLDNDPKTKNDLTKREREVYEIILKNQHKEPLFRNMETLLDELIKSK